MGCGCVCAVAVAREIDGRRPEALCIRIVILAANEQESGRGSICNDFQSIRTHKSFGKLGCSGFGEIVVEAVAAVRNRDEAVLAVEN